MSEVSRELPDLGPEVLQTLHSYSAALVGIKHTVEAILSSLGDDPFAAQHEPSLGSIEEFVGASVRKLIEDLRKLLKDAEEDRSSALPMRAWVALQRLADDLEGLGTLQYRAFLVPVARGYASEVVKLCLRIDRGRFQTSAPRIVVEDAVELIRVCNLATLHQVVFGITDSDEEVRLLQEYIASRTANQTRKTVERVERLIDSAVSSQYEYAENRGVRIRPDIECHSMIVQVVRRDVVRALRNLLQNAVKFSQPQEGSGDKAVDVRCRATSWHVSIVIENRGVPIAHDEIEQGLIFRLGYRGRMSIRSGRLGSGIGLADAHRVAEQQGGTLLINSAPDGCAIVDEKDPHYYEQSFLTKATLKLPLYEGGPDVEEQSIVD